jgi:tRNA dimethylallyltransferase
MVAERAPAAAAQVPDTDGHRLVRALELLDAGHEPPQRDGPSELWTQTTRHPTHLAALTMDREALYVQIDARVDAMIAAGAADEVRRAHERGASATARKALGFEALLADDVDAMKQATRRYARRQLTWLRKLPGVQAIDVTDRTATEVAEEIATALR